MVCIWYQLYHDPIRGLASARWAQLNEAEPNACIVYKASLLHCRLPTTLRDHKNMLLVTAEFKWECAFNPHFRMITKWTDKIDLDSKVFTPAVGAVWPIAMGWQDSGSKWISPEILWLGIHGPATTGSVCCWNLRCH